MFSSGITNGAFNRMVNEGDGMKEENSVYRLTPKGVIYGEVKDEPLAEKVVRSLELNALRLGMNAILINSKGLTFVEIELNEEK